MDNRFDLDRLTDGEKECLRRFLSHQTAKEMAIDLGVTHHAVEKRLKQARDKLGADSSLEAARILAEAEGYVQTVSGSPELSQKTETKQDSWTKQPLVMGVLTMSLITATAIILLAQQAGSTAGQTAETVSQGGYELDEVFEPAREQENDQFEIQREFVPEGELDASNFEIQQQFRPVDQAEKQRFELQREFNPERDNEQPATNPG